MHHTGASLSLSLSPEDSGAGGRGQDERPYLQEPLSRVEGAEVGPVEGGGGVVPAGREHLVHVRRPPQSVVAHQEGHAVLAASGGGRGDGGVR